MKKLIKGIAITFCFTAAVFAVSNAFKAKPFVFDPDDTGIITAEWRSGIGLPDAGRSNHGLFFRKNGPTATFAYGGAEIKGVHGLMLSELGFDFANGGHCSASSPRFNVEATDGSHIIGGCSNCTKTPDFPVPGWTRVRCDPSNPAHAFPPVAAGATVRTIALISNDGTDAAPDFTGTIVTDNIDINGTLIGKPGNAR